MSLMHNFPVSLDRFIAKFVMSKAHHRLLDVIYITTTIVLLFSYSVVSNRVYVTGDSVIIEGKLHVNLLNPFP